MLKCNKIYIKTSCQGSDTVRCREANVSAKLLMEPWGEQERVPNWEGLAAGLGAQPDSLFPFTKKVLFGLWGMVSDSSRARGICHVLGEHLGCQLKPS